MRYTKRVSWHHRSLPCVIQKNIRTLDATPTHTHTHIHTHTRTTRPQRPQFGVSLHILKLPSSDLRHVLGLTPSRKQKDAESERSNLLHIFNFQQSVIPCWTSKVSSKVGRGIDVPTFHISRGYLLHTLTLSCIQTNHSRMQKDAESEQHKQTLFMTLSGEVRRALEVMLSRKQQHGKSDRDIFFCVSSILFRNPRQAVKLK